MYDLNNSYCHFQSAHLKEIVHLPFLAPNIQWKVFTHWGPLLCLKMEMFLACFWQLQHKSITVFGQGEIIIVVLVGTGCLK